ncbi:RNA methyltransferase [Candidatus Roizmanbacteria bacterium CG09_land_8_20_14_0_10_41_9]|uniref:RNA methyltransferase n=1 Tax=Candidatus Roizmanbacteria bacterium CG09_land_8_20_14_0_10_41_9 TaxID=1974850 RepID=A0A2H0WTN8_9BACT|nr:MAG: RNA methyltransferase [Candidatus Roizmanbacteria bacterium CG09_land_8_20_14_0_10_41_9]
MIKLNARQLRDVGEAEVSEKIKQVERHPIYFILENIYDTYNIGGLFRLADAIGVEKIYLCGQTEVPPNSRIKKASIGTYKVVPWEYKRSAGEAIADLKFKSPSFAEATAGKQKSKIKIIAVEQSKKAIRYTKLEYSFPLALIVGNETSGILPETLDTVDTIVEIPMWGINKSLNVIVSAAIVSYWIMNRLKDKSACDF